MIKRITELLVVMSIVIGQIQFLLFSLVGIEYDPEEGTGLVAYLNLTFFGICVGWVCWQELNSKAKNYVMWPFFLIAFIIFSFFLESSVSTEVTMKSFAGRQFLFFGAGGVPAIFLATYIYKHDRFDIVARNAEIIMLLGTVALVLNIPTMMSETAFQTIGGGGGHQDISYTAAFFFTINLTNILSRNTDYRYNIFLSKIFRYIFFALLPVQALICILGGGRGGGVLLVLGFLCILYIYSHQNLGKALRWGVLVIVAFAIVTVYTGALSDGLGRTFDYLQGGSVNLTVNQSDIERAMLRQKAYDIIGDSLLIGHGLWNGLIVSGYYMHNVFLDVLISGGLLYLIVILFVMKRVYKTSYRILQTDNTKCMLLPFLLYPTTLLQFSGFYLTNSLFWFCTILALLYSKQYCVR